MLKKLIFAAGLGYLSRRLMGGRRTGPGAMSGGIGGGRWGRRGW
jgi:hypothetical protein